jgi:hypothetical protein
MSWMADEMVSNEDGAEDFFRVAFHVRLHVGDYGGTNLEGGNCVVSIGQMGKGS